MKRMLVWLLSLAIFCALVPSAMADSWTCPDCGKKNSGDYCGECGRYVHANVEREINLVRSEDWFCLNCGNISTDKFCSSCGCKRSEGMEGSFVRYGAYEQDDNIRNGDEDIEWVVVSEESDSLTLLSLYLLDAQSFDDSQSTNRWSDSSLRVWLHISFLPKAFSETELRYFLQNESDLVSLMPRGMANSALIQREARIAEATTSARNRAEGWIDSNCWFIIDGGVCGYVDGDKGNLGSFCSGGEKQTMYVRPMIVIRNIPAMEEQYQQGLALLESEEYEEALNIFEGIRIYKDSAEKITLLENLILEKQYQYGLVLLENEEYEEALNIFQGIKIYKDSAEKIKLLENLITEKQYQYGLVLLENEEYDEALNIFQGIREYKDSAQKIASILEEKYNAAVALMEEGKYEEAIAAFKAVRGYRDSESRIAKCEKAIEELRLQAQYDAAVSLADSGKTVEAAIAFGKLGDYQDARQRSAECWNIAAVRDTVSAGRFHTVGLKSDGTVLAIGYNQYGQCDVESWQNIITVSAGGCYTVGAKSDGTVVAVGANEEGQCNVADWENIVSIGAGEYHTVALRSDGTVMATGWNKYGQCNVEDWTDIVAVSAGQSHTVGLKADGTVVATGWNEQGQCEVGDWTEIVAISSGCYHTVGIKANGTVVVAGKNTDSWFNVGFKSSKGGFVATTNTDNTWRNVGGWSDIIAVSAGIAQTVGIKSDGTVVAVGDNLYGRCDVSDWTDIVAVSTRNGHTVGLKSDGTVVTTGGNEDGQCDVSGWTDIRLPD